MYHHVCTMQDLPGLGQFYCVPCARHFADAVTLETHNQSKLHRRRIKVCKSSATNNHYSSVLCAIHYLNLIHDIILLLYAGRYSRTIFTSRIRQSCGKIKRNTTLCSSIEASSSSYVIIFNNRSSYQRKI